jgi:sugar phosphate isomerase/epimerase
MVQDERTARPAGGGDAGEPPGIRWEPGDEDYPFAAVPGETALDFLARWLDEAGYARIERGGVRYLHETDVVNLLNHVTADVGLLRARLSTFGDHVVTAEAHDETVDRIERAVAELGQALDTLRQARG